MLSLFATSSVRDVIRFQSISVWRQSLIRFGRQLHRTERFIQTHIRYIYTYMRTYDQSASDAIARPCGVVIDSLSMQETMSSSSTSTLYSPYSQQFQHAVAACRVTCIVTKLLYAACHPTRRRCCDDLLSSWSVCNGTQHRNSESRFDTLETHRHLHKSSQDAPPRAKFGTNTSATRLFFTLHFERRSNIGTYNRYASIEVEIVREWWDYYPQRVHDLIELLFTIKMISNL